MANYYRITAYCKEEDFCFILDSNGRFEKPWEFSSYVVNKGIKVLEVSKEENMLDVNITKVEQDNENLNLRTYDDGMPKYIEYNLNGTTYKAVQVADKIYIPNKENR